MISIIVPVYNEEKVLSRNHSYFQNLSKEAEVIFVDGQSSDKSREIAGLYGLVLISRRGRFRQMNHGARHASAGILLFMHADSFIFPGALSAIEKKLADKAFIGGCLTQRIDNDALIYRLIEWQGNARARLTKEFYGDQGIFVRKDVFFEINGFPEVPVMEDALFTRRLRRQGRTVVLADKIVVSARRWEKDGLARTMFIYILISLLFYLRFPLDKVKKLYGDLR